MADWLKNLLAKALGDTQSASEPLVVARAVCDAVDEKIRVLPRGRKIFPYKELSVQFRAPNREAREALRASFADRNELQTRIRQHLERQQVEGASAVRVRVDILTGPEPAWAARGFNIVYHTEDKPPRPATLTILIGQAAQPQYTLKEKNRIGRGEEVMDKHGRLLQRNDVVFTDNQDEINRSVSRIQSRIEFDPAEDAYSLFDDNSAQGTSIERDGEIRAVAGSRGVALKDGDLIFFGKARTRFFLLAEPDD